MRGRQTIEMLGFVKGKLTVIAAAEPFDSKRGWSESGWLCRCECGNTKRYRGSHLRNSPVVSCGCVRHEMITNLKYRHGAARKGSMTREFVAWCAAKERCFNPNAEKYADYGGRGITMAAEWVDDFAAFLAHIGLKPDPSMSLDRIEVDGNYEPGNVRWATPHMQRVNQRRMRAA